MTLLIDLKVAYRDVKGGRLAVHVVRGLRNKQSKAEKAEAKSGKYIAPKVSVKELKQLFVHITDQTIRYRLRDKCECIPVRVSCSKGPHLCLNAILPLCVAAFCDARMQQPNKHFLMTSAC